MAWLQSVLGISIGIWILLGIYVFSEVKKTYEINEVFTSKLLTLWLVMWGFYHLAVILSALYGLWLIPINKLFALTAGLILVVVGVVILAAGMINFSSLRRSCGQDISKLITTGMYRWSRNPQFIGCLIYLLGIALAGRSGLAFTLTGAAAIVIYWYTVRLAEPYLERLYGEEYIFYKSRTGRWISMPK